MGRYDFTGLRDAIVQNEIPQEQVHNATPTNPLLVSNPNMGWNTTGGVDRSSEYYKAGQQARKNALFESIWSANEKPKPTTLKAKYIDAEDALNTAKTNLGYATDPEQERQLRAELKTAQENYDAAKKEYDASKMQEAQVLTEEQASGNAPITTKSGRTYVGTGNKAQNPEKAARRTEELQQAANALNEAKTNLGYATDSASEAEARKALNEAQANYDRLLGKHYVSDEERVGLTGKGAVKGWSADMMNAGATAAAGLSQLSEKLGGDTGEYAGWATDEVSRAAIPEQHDSKYYENQRQEIADIQSASDRLAASGQADIENAKKDTRGITKLAVDIGSNAVQMGMDGLAAVLTGGSSLGAMFARSAGGAAREARNDGASVAQQVAYGVVRGGIEVATEKMFDGLAGIYGAGGADDVVELVIDKMAKSDLGRTALRTMFSGVGEAIEEGISGATEPLTQAIYKGIDSIPKGYNKEQASEVLYSMLVGFAMGGAGGTVNIVNGNNANANAELRQVDAIRNSLADTAMANSAGRWLSTGRDPNAGIRPSAEFEEQNVRANQQANNTNAETPTVTGRNGRTYEGVGQKAQNPERTAQNPANATDAGGYNGWDSEYRGYQITFEKGNYLNRLGTHYKITSPDGRFVGFVPISSKALAQITEDVNNDISLHAEAQQTETPTPATPPAEAQPVDASAPVPSEPATPARTVEAVQAELDPILNEISEIDKAIAENDAAMKQMMAEAESPDDRAIIRGQANQVKQSLEADKARLQEQADALRKEQRDIRSTEIKAEKDRLSAGREATGARKAPNPQPETHIDNRTTESVGKSNVNAFQYDNPEVKPFYKRAAEILMRDLGFMQSSKRSERGNGTVFGASNQFLERVSSYFGSLNDAIKACEQIIYDKGRENFADPKRIELFLDEMLSNGYEPVDTSLPIIQASSDYLALKGSLQGGAQYDPRARAIQAEMASDFTGSMTEEEAGAIVDRNYAETGFYDPYTRDGQADPSVNEGRKTFEDIDAADTASMEEKYGRGNTAETQDTANRPAEQAETPTDQRDADTNESEQFNSNPEDGNDNSPSNETWSGDEVPTQSTFHDQLTEEERTRDELNPENDTHVQHHDSEVDNYAQNRITEKGHEGAREDLMSRDPAEWDDVDVRTAQMLLSEELENARKLTGEEQDAAYRRIAELKNAYNKQGTEAGRTLRQRQRFGGTKAEIVSEAANILYGDENTGKLRKLSPEQKSQIMQQVDEFSTRMENAQDGDTKSLKDIIMEVAKIRNTHGILDFGQGKLGKVIDAVAKSEGGMDFLRQIATTQIRSIASDQIRTSFADKAKALRYMNMLSNPATASRNVGANTVFGNFIDAISSNLSSPVDAFMGLFTGRRTVANERLSKAGLKGSIDAGLKSWLEVTLDAEAEQSTYAYNEIKGRAFKASGNFVERLMSAFERNQGYQLKTTDQIAKGGIEAEQRRALGKLGERTGKVDADTIDTLAQEEARYRTLQNESSLGKAAQGLRKALNVFGIKDKNGNTVYGLGEDILPFAQVPANVVQTELNMNPLAIFPAIGRVFGVMANGKNATPQQQRAAAKAFGQAVNGTAMVTAAALMSAKGVLRYTDDDDKDQKQLHKAEGKSGLQINFSAAARLFTGGDPSEQDGDKWGNIGWIPQLNSLLIIGNMVYDDYKDMPEHKELADWAKLGGNVALDSLQGMYESILEFPAVSTISSMVNAWNYANVPEGASEGEELLTRFGSVAADKVANTATGFTIPNVLRATAAGLDDTERNLYSADNRLDQALDSIKAGIPDNPLIPQQYTRGSLPAQTDNFGNPIKNDGGTQQFLNKVILPGAITTDRENAVLDEIDRVAMASGNADAIPDKNGAYTVKNGKDTFTLTGEERIAYQQYAGKRSEEYIRSFIGSSLYSQMNDDQRAETMAKLNQQAKSEANKHYLEQKGIKSVDKLTEGKDAPGTSYDYTPLNKSNVATYYAYETMMKQAVEDGDYSTIDNLARRYNSLNGNLQTVLSERDDSLRAVLKWSSAGIGSQTYYSFVEASKASQARLDKSSRTGSTVELDALANMNISEAEKRRIIDNVEGVGSKTVIGVYDILADYGFTSKQINDFWTTSQDWVNKNTGEAQSSQKAGTLQPLEAAYAIQQLPGLDDNQRTDIYNRMREVANVPYKINDWGNYTYGSEVNYLASGRAYQNFGASQNPLASASTGGIERPRGQQPNYIMQALQGMAG